MGEQQPEVLQQPEALQQPKAPEGPRALVLSGGGAHGSYQVGVLKRLAEKGHSWGIVAGVSVGALNGTMFAQYPEIRAAEGALRLEDVWRGLKGNSSIYKSWFFGKFASLWKGGMYDSSPLEDVIRKNFDPKKLRDSGILLRIGCVGFGSGKYRCVCEKDENIPDWIMASTAFEMAFPPRWIGGEAYMDGGICDCTPVRDVLAEKPSHIDVVLTFPEAGDLGPADPKKAKSVIEVGLRSVAIMFNEVILNDLASIPEEDRRKVTIYAPRICLPYDSLDFAPDNLSRAIAMGYEDAA